MKTLQEYLVEASRYGYSKLFAVMNEVWSEKDIIKFNTALNKLVYDIIGNKEIMFDDGDDWTETGEYDKKCFGKAWCLSWRYINNDDLNKISKYFEKTFGIKPIRAAYPSFQYAMPIDITKAINVSLPKEIHTSLCMTDDDIHIYTMVYINEIRDRLEK